MAEFFDALPIDWLEPGETMALEVDDMPVAIANVEGQFFAFSNLCPHQGSGLAGRRMENGCIIVCPNHASRYDVRTGECVQPAPDGFSQDLLMFATRVVDDVVQVQL